MHDGLMTVVLPLWIAERTNGLLLAGCCALYALAAGQPAWLAAVVLLAGGAVHVFGELLLSAGSWALAFDLAPEHAHGQYQGVFNMSIQLRAGLAAPVVAKWAAGRTVVAG